ncbi:polysaccharide deacetylase family protein [Sediminitomix flava]|uniref:Polysaccharide deacetylase n=1 Tax=Sediminitomix flava TaxID=379075 RepID=A0A315ZD27_SEDFL|nr:polysaccharide deacetylase family protein [Sediminitomix flava]PWJ43192.1 polysaccharide deacetylase [Sediminitomix flava]
MRISLFFIFILLIGCTSHNLQNVENSKTEKPIISFTFDDGSIRDMPGYTLKEWNEQILTTLDKHKIKAVLFPAGSFLKGEKGEYILSSWNDDGHKIGNHTYNHPYYHSDKISLNDFKQELIKNDSIVKKYSNFIPLFRFPYLKEGNTIEKRDGFREFLSAQNYKMGYVTVDASDWYVNSKLLKTLKQDSTADVSGYKDFYVQHLLDRANYYDSLATKLTDRKVKHNLLLHHNLTSALFLDTLITSFKKNGWEVISAHEAFEDSIYNRLPNNLPAGESLIWALAKESGKYEKELRYPAEDSRYEKAKMEELGL